MSDDKNILRITLPGAVSEKIEDLHPIFEKIGTAERISQATKNLKVLSFPLGTQKIDFEHNSMKNNETFLLKICKYQNKQT